MLRTVFLQLPEYTLRGTAVAAGCGHAHAERQRRGGACARCRCTAATCPPPSASAPPRPPLRRPLRVGMGMDMDMSTGMCQASCCDEPKAKKTRTQETPNKAHPHPTTRHATQTPSRATLVRIFRAVQNPERKPGAREMPRWNDWTATWPKLGAVHQRARPAAAAGLGTSLRCICRGRCKYWEMRESRPTGGVYGKGSVAPAASDHSLSGGVQGSRARGERWHGGRAKRAHVHAGGRWRRFRRCATCYMLHACLLCARRRTESGDRCDAATVKRGFGWCRRLAALALAG